jgi:hypothetical protein
MKRLCFVAAALLASCPARASAQDQPPGAEVNRAIDKGVAYLKGLQKEDGTWRRADKNERGSTILAAWTLLECQVSPNDPAVRKAADHIRGFILESNRTYDIALGILFFDRLGDPEDEPLLEALALQLLGGQHWTNGWAYICPPLPDKILTRLREHVAKVKEAGPRQLPEKAGERKPREAAKVHPDVMAAAMDVNRKPLPPTKHDTVDHSNTQFAVLALWVARRHGMPVDYALWKTEQRFRALQQKVGGWSYAQLPDIDKMPPGVPKPPPAVPTAAMTACGLLSIAVGNQCAPPKGMKTDLAADPAVKGGLYVLSASIGEVGQPRAKLLLDNGGRSFYFLWTLERMAVIYNFKTIGGKDWYRWGAELLLANQKDDGSWQGEFAEGGCDTCFALLFLKRTNVAPDLTTLVGDKVKDPGKAPDKLLDLIGQEVEPGTGKKSSPKKNAPVPELPPPSPPRAELECAGPPDQGGCCSSRRPSLVPGRVDR